MPNPTTVTPRRGRPTAFRLKPLTRQRILNLAGKLETTQIGVVERAVEELASRLEVQAERTKSG